MKHPKFEYLLRLGDNSLILGHRLSEWCGHGPILEQDIALINISLDLIGHARNWLAYAGETEGKGRNEDTLAYKRDIMDFRNVQLAEQPNGNWGDTLVRQFLFDVFNYHLHEALVKSPDAGISGIAGKSLKEIAYHRRFSSEWVIRLGDGTPESHAKMQQALDDLWTYTGELFEADETDLAMQQEFGCPDLAAIRVTWEKEVDAILAEATLTRPSVTWMQKGGKQGNHTEHLGYILAEMQFLPRAYPDATW